MRAVLALMSIASVAHADSDDLVGRAVVLDRGEVEAALTLAANLRTGTTGDPASLALDAWFGVTPALTVGLVHSARSVDEIEPDRSLDQWGIDARYAVHRSIAPRARLLLRDSDPFKPALTVGALARWHHGRFGVAADPYLRVGLANTDLGNRATLNIPVWLAVQPTCKWVIGGRIGYDSALAVLSDGWRGPAGVFVGVHPIAPIEIYVELGARSVIGPQHEYKERVFMLTIDWRQQVLQ